MRTLQWKLFPILLTLIFSACSKDEVVKKGGISFSIDRESILAAPGGIAIYGKTTEGVQRYMAVAIPQDVTSQSIVLPQGKWLFAAIGFTQFPPLSATGAPPNCFIMTAPVDISGENEVVVPLTITTGCTTGDIAAFDGIGTGSGTNFTPLHIMSCKSYNGIDPAANPGDECDIPFSNRGGVSAYRFELMSYDPVLNIPLPGIQSACISNTTNATETTTLSQNQAHFPLGVGALGIPIPTRIIAYGDSMCDFVRSEYFFQTV